jgi:hypothetical protein
VLSTWKYLKVPQVSYSYVSFESRLDHPGLTLGPLDGKTTQRELKVLKNLLKGLPQLSKESLELVKECFNARKTLAFETLAQLTGS